ncbi:uncharacterized protein BJ171DRAFT_441063 [Polychytrium aggregatum]|uniref:uncharacterized protein n=1 Tax=Polychytrium aggregatum TaxID=110093 RepID=UPI0022FE7964|nr:uncharacterized protein BJ171DRAFT_441063 [Polychytrium aggregatum]KAI9205875.1 hypothetical protein BJ171DRAFT_441063 [Polychytrium aggregatum]
MVKAGHPTSSPQKKGSADASHGKPFFPVSVFRRSTDASAHGCVHLQKAKLRSNSEEFFDSFRTCVRYSMCHQARFHLHMTKKARKALVEEEAAMIANGGGTGKKRKRGVLEKEMTAMEKLPSPQCVVCDETLGRLHSCIECVYIGCWKDGHMKKHFSEANHNFALDLSHYTVYCAACHDYVYDLELESIVQSERTRTDAFISRVKEPSVRRVRPVEWTATSEETEFIKTHADLQRCGGLRGLRNMGSTCFMNAVLQTFIHNPLLRGHFLADKHDAARCPNQSCMACEIDKLFSNSYTTNVSTPYGPTAILYQMWMSQKHLARYSQQDAHEFFISILSAIHSGCVGTEETPNCQCVVHQVFSGLLQSDVTCLKCYNVTTVNDPMLDLSLDLKNTAKSAKKIKKKLDDTVTPTSEESARIRHDDGCTLVDCLDRFTHPERLGSQEYTCANCDNTPQEATKQLSIKKLPPVLGIQLKRFEHTAVSSSKIETFVRVPTDLDMTPYTSRSVKLRMKKATVKKDTTTPIKKTVLKGPSQFDYQVDTVPAHRYSLFAIVNHQGKLETGHYTACVKYRGEWFNIDDHSITLTDPQAALENQIYMCFYVRENLELCDGTAAELPQQTPVADGAGDVSATSTVPPPGPLTS